MTRPRRIDPHEFAQRVPPGLPAQEHHRRIAETIRAAVIASKGTVQIHRACPTCDKIMRLGGTKWDSGSDGTMTRVYCSTFCKNVANHRKQPKLKKRKRNAS